MLLCRQPIVHKLLFTTTTTTNTVPSARIPSFPHL